MWRILRETRDQSTKIGIPRALLYYWYGSLWETFWQKSGLQVLVSPLTDRSIILAGAEAALDEFCLPIKIFLGHVKLLEPQVDLIMIPHLVKVEKDAFICPKFMGLPDVVHHTLPQACRKMLLVKVGPKRPEMMQSLRYAALTQGWNPPRHLEWNGLLNLPPNCTPAVTSPQQPTIGLLGHPYCLYDSAFNLQLLQLLSKNGVRYLTPEMVPDVFRGQGAKYLSKKLFWTIGRRQFDALEWMLHHQTVQGFIHVAAFACGIEAIVGEIIERLIKEAGIPLLNLNFDEHSGEAGFHTRIEAFLDLLRLRIQAC